MSAFVWKHNVTADEARRLIQMKLAGDGVNQYVTWKGNEFFASMGWGIILKVNGAVTKEAICLNQVSGAIASTVLMRTRDELASLFPDGYELSVCQGI